MKKTKILFVIWAIIVLIIIGLLTTLGFILKFKNEKYHDLEEQLVESANLYAHNELLLEEKEFVVSTDELIEKKYLESSKVSDDVCSGYVIITNDGKFHYDAYIKCSKYTTKGFIENK